jgi:hypothetical protein
MDKIASARMIISAKKREKGCCCTGSLVEAARCSFGIVFSYVHWVKEWAMGERKD